MLVARIRSFLADESGATAIEYALMASLIAMAIVASFMVLGDSLKALFDNGIAEVLDEQTAKLD